MIGCVAMRLKQPCSKVYRMMKEKNVINDFDEVSSRIVRDMQYARIIEILAERLHTSREEAMELFYSSPVFELIDQGVADLNCRSDKYLADEIILSYKY